MTVVPKFRTFEEARQAFMEDRYMLEDAGFSWHGYTPHTYIPESWKRDYRLAVDELSGALQKMYGQGFGQDAAITPVSLDPNAGVPWALTNMIDPTIFKILFAPVVMAEILGEQKKGTWTDRTIQFPVIEHSGEVETYGDNNEGGNANVTINFPGRQAYMMQTVIRYGDLEVDMAGLAKINYVSELGVSAANALNRYLNLIYAYGVAGLQNYGTLNDPHLPAALSPATKAAYGTTGTNAWYYNGAPNATPNEVYNDILAMYYALVNNTLGLVNEDTPLMLALSPQSQTALKFVNSFNVNVTTLLKDNFKNLTIKTAPQYAVKSAANPEGIAAGNLMQLMAPELDGQKQSFCAYNEKLRSFPIVRGLSNYKQKQMSGAWGAVFRSTVGVQQMIGV